MGDLARCNFKECERVKSCERFRDMECEYNIRFVCKKETGFELFIQNNVPLEPLVAVVKIENKVEKIIKEDEPKTEEKEPLAEKKIEEEPKQQNN